MSTKMHTNSRIHETLGPGEMRVYLELSRNVMMSLAEIARGFENYRTARTVASRLVRKGYALRPRQGVYAAIPPEMVGADNYEVDRYILADVIVRPEGALAYHTALELHGVAQSYFNTVRAFTASPKQGFEHQDVEYVFSLPGKIFGTTTIARSNVEVRVTDRERTFLDCLRRLDYCGGPEEFLKSVQGFHMLDFENMKTHLKEFGERGLYQKTGYILTLLKRDFAPPAEFMDYLKKNTGQRANYLLPRAAPGSGRLDKEWDIIAPKNIGELMRFV